MVFKEIGAMEYWKPINPGDTIEGTYVDVKQGGKYGDTYVLNTRVGILGLPNLKVLGAKMSTVNLGALVRITYLGLKSPESGNNNYKDFKVQVDDGQPAVEVIA